MGGDEEIYKCYEPVSSNEEAVRFHLSNPDRLEDF